MADIGTFVSATTESSGMLDDDDLREVDELLLDYLNEGRVTPGYAKKLLFDDLDEYSRGYVQQRLARLEEHDHAVNLRDSGLYALLDDPREDVPKSDDQTDALLEAFEDMETAFERGDGDAARDALDRARETLREGDPDDSNG